MATLKLTIGSTYVVLRADKTRVTFKFTGSNGGVVDGQQMTIHEILGAYLDVWEVNP